MLPASKISKSFVSAIDHNIPVVIETDASLNKTVFDLTSKINVSTSKN